MLYEELPVGVTSVSDDASGSYDPTSHLWTIGDLISTNNKKLVITVSVDLGMAGQVFDNAACVHMINQTDNDNTNECGSVAITGMPQTTIQPAAQDLDRGVSNALDNISPTEGGTVTFSFLATNYGPTAATGLIL